MFKIIDNSIEWEQVINEFDDLDVYYSYEYCKSFSKIEKGIPLSAYYETNKGKVFYSFIMREIQIEVGFEEKLYDLITPYGYGGPYIEGDTSIIHPFYENFKEFCLENNIITEVIGFHPLIKNHIYCEKIMSLEYVRKIVSVNLNKTLEDIRDGYTKSLSRNIRKLLKQGAKVFEVEKNIKNIKMFQDIYYETMEKNSAQKFYYFDEELFVNQLKNTTLCNSELMFCELNNKIIAGAILLIGKNYAHTFLSGSLMDYRKYSPSSLIKDRAIILAKNKNCSYLNLGGGYKDNDGLFLFKSSFSKDYFDYFLGKNIYNQKVYKQLVNKIKEDNDINQNFFPIYRG